MEYALAGVVKEERESALAQKDNDLIRSFQVSEHLQSAYPMDDSPGAWRLVHEMVVEDTRSTSAIRMVGLFLHFLRC